MPIWILMCLCVCAFIFHKCFQFSDIKRMCSSFAPFQNWHVNRLIWWFGIHCLFAIQLCVYFTDFVQWCINKLKCYDEHIPILNTHFKWKWWNQSLEKIGWSIFFFFLSHRLPSVLFAFESKTVDTQIPINIEFERWKDEVCPLKLARDGESYKWINVQGLHRANGEWRW